MVTRQAARLRVLEPWLKSRGDAADPLGLTGHFSPVVTGKNGSIMGYLYIYIHTIYGEYMGYMMVNSQSWNNWLMIIYGYIMIIIWIISTIARYMMVIIWIRN